MIEFISQLPIEYQEVEYIQSSGTQYIDTGYKPTGENMRLVMDYMYSASPNGKSLFGAESSSTFPITFYSRSATTAEFYIGSTYVVVSYNITTGTRYKLDCHANNGVFTANLNEAAKSETYSGSLLKTINLFLFTNNGQQSTQLISARLYSCQIYDNEILVRDFVPCYRKADGAVGLYDLVNNVFYTNAGSGVFAVGSNTGEIVITPGGIISFSAALRRRMMINVSKGLPISDLPLGALINVGTDGGAGTPNYEIADKDHLVSGGVVLVRKNIYSNSGFGSSANYPNGPLDNLIQTTIYNKMPQKLRDKMMDVSFTLYSSGNITRKMFAPTFTMVGFGNNSGVAEGKALQLYTSNASRVKTLNGSAAGWWLSSQYTFTSTWYVNSAGYTGNVSLPYSFGVVPAFAISSETHYNVTPNTDGSYNLIL